jgi:hypothetical protein
MSRPGAVAAGRATRLASRLGVVSPVAAATPLPAASSPARSGAGAARLAAARRPRDGRAARRRDYGAWPQFAPQLRKELCETVTRRRTEGAYA